MKIKKDIILKYTLFSSIFLLIDLTTKLFAVYNFQTPFSLIKNLFILRYTENIGVAFSIPIPAYISIPLNLILLSFLLIFAFQELNTKTVTILSASMIIGGGLGNILDRMLRGYVVDFISIWKYPSFNFADIFIVIGIFAIIVFYNKMKLSLTPKK